jgi:hypothetical protein
MRLCLLIPACLLGFAPISAQAKPFICFLNTFAKYLHINQAPELEVEADFAFGYGTSSLAARLAIDDLHIRLVSMVQQYGTPNGPYRMVSHPHFYNSWGAIFLYGAKHEGGFEVGYTDPTTHQSLRRLISQREAQEYIHHREKNSRDFSEVIHGPNRYDPIAITQQYNTPVFTTPLGKAVYLESLAP